MSEEKNIPGENFEDKKLNPYSYRDESGNENISQQEIKLPQTSDPEPQTTQMEVQKHPHHVTHKKRGAEYLLEFLMIFLAVFLGFIAENMREQTVEHKRAKEYAHLLMMDVQQDLGGLSQAKRILNRITISGDSLGQLLNPANRNVPGGKLYYYEYWTAWRWRFVSRDATLQQLKSSGSLRYLGNTSLVRKLLNYEEAVRVIYLLQDENEPLKTANWNLVQQVFDLARFRTLDSIKSADLDSSFKETNLDDWQLSRFMNTNYPLLSYDKNKLEEIRNGAYGSSRNYRVLVRTIEATEGKAREVLAALKKEYRFE